MSVDAALSTSLLCLVFGKMSPGKKTRKKPPRIFPPGKLPSANMSPRKIAP